jgi:AcrR family transcriptional regulator
MRSEARTEGQDRSFIEKARRRQIVATAIEIIASRGLADASLAEIARQAGCSKGVISYHFGSKQELMDAILRRLLREPAAYIKIRVEAHETAEDRLMAYVEANFEFMQTHPNHYNALVDLWGSRFDDDGKNHFQTEAYEPSRHYLDNILRQGMKSGEFRELSGPTLAAVTQAVIDGVMLQWVIDPKSVDLQACKREILIMVRNHVSNRGVS